MMVKTPITTCIVNIQQSVPLSQLSWLRLRNIAIASARVQTAVHSFPHPLCV